MKTTALIVISVLCAATLSAQPTNPTVIGQEGVLSIHPLFQRWYLPNGVAFSQASSVLSLYQPLARNASLTLRAAGGATSGDVTAVSGLADVQIGLNYHWEDPHIVFTLGVSAPAGKKELTADEFSTTLLTGNPVFALLLPGLGAGLTVNPGVIWAIPLGEDVVAGIGGSYQYKAKFKPLKGFGMYDPGDEVLATAGLDVGTGKTASFSVDAVFTRYEKDKLDGKDVLASGNKVIASAQYRCSFGHDELWLFVRYRTKAKNEIAVGNVFVPEANKLTPDNVDVAAAYSVYLGKSVSVRFLGTASNYKATPAAFTGITLLGAGISPIFTVSTNVSIPLTFKAQFASLTGGGTLTGLEGGVGIVVTY